MSNWRPEFEEDSGVGALVSWFGSYYHVLVLAGLLVFTLWNRAKSWGNFVVDGTILFPGNDPWYHYRATAYAVEHFPNNIPFDPHTYFSTGTSNSQFGTILDQSVALVALVVGLGNPSDELVRQILLFTPVVIGLAILPVAYVLGRRFGGSRFTGLASAAIVAFSAGILLARSTVGFADHHVAEALLQATAALGFVVAVSVADREKPIYELLAERDVGALRGTLGWGTLAGVATGLYIWVWPPGILMIGIIGLFFLVSLNVEYLRGNSPEHLAIVGGVAMLATGVMNLATVSELTFRATGNSLLQPLLAFGLLGWLALVSYQARVWDDRGYSRYAFPLLQVGVLAAGVVFAMVALPTLFDRMFQQVVKVLGFMFPQTAVVGTVGETEPLRFSQLDSLVTRHGFAPLLAAGGVVMILLRQVTDEEGWAEVGLGVVWLALTAVAAVTGFVGLAIGMLVAGLAGLVLRFLVERRADPAELFLVVWFGMIFTATLTQSRFQYYLVVPMATLAVIPIGKAMSFIGRITPEDGGIQGYQIMAVATVLLLVIAPMFVFVGAGQQGDPLRATQTGPGNAIVGWSDSLEWMNEETPAVGQLENPDGEPLDFMGQFPIQDDFDYRAGDYGVVSWWDYGHWITGVGERVPNANPFQQGATDAARFLLAGNDEEAASALAGVEESDAKTRYAVVDWKMVESMSARPVRGKFFAPSTFHPNYTGYGGFTGNTFVRPVALRERTRARLARIYVHNQSYYETMAVRLYRFHGSAKDPARFATDWDLTPQKVDIDRDPEPDKRVAVVPRSGDFLRQFRNHSAAAEYARDDGTAQVGGIGGHPPERVPALNHWRLVQASDMDAMQASRGFILGALHTIRGANVTDLLAQRPRYGQFGGNVLTQLALEWLNPPSTAWSKVFERVPGARIQGTAPPNKTVTAAVQLQIPARGNNASGTNFTYKQEAQTGADGRFELTVPYSTEGYDNWGPADGYTNVSVRALGPYELRTGLERQPDGNLTFWRGSVNVTEAAVIGERTEPFTVELDEEQPVPDRNVTVGGNETDGGGTSSDGGGSDGGGGADGSNGSMTPPLRLEAATRAAT